MSILLLLMLQLTLAQEKSLAQPSHPYYCCAVTIRARYEDGRYVHKGETRCLDASWVDYTEGAPDGAGDIVQQSVPAGWVRQDSYGGSVWRTHPRRDVCEARDGKGKFGSATIVWEKPTSTQYIIVK